MRVFQRCAWLLLLLLLCGTLILVGCDQNDEGPEQTDPCAAGHNYGTVVKVTDPTCTAQGTGKQTCTLCGAEKSVDIPALGHTESAWITDTEATCTVDGTRHKECTVCKETLNSSPISAQGHKKSEWITDKDPSCEVSGVRHKECLNCGDTLETGIINPTYHANTYTKVTLAATCTAEGRKQELCLDCEKPLRSYRIAPLDHPRIEWRVTTAPTCTESGVEAKYCFECESLTGDTRTKNPTGHTEGEWFVRGEQGTCTTDELRYQVCATCGVEIANETVKAEGHHPGTPEITSASCTVDGVRRVSCTVCTAVLEEEVLPCTGHTEGELMITKEPTCTEQGEGYQNCSVCSEELFNGAIPAKGHTPGEHKVDKQPLCESEGTWYADCTVCPATRVETGRIAAKGHTEGDWVIDKPAGCTTEGQKHLPCTECGKTISTVRIPITGHVGLEWQELSAGSPYMRYYCTACNTVMDGKSKVNKEDVVIVSGSTHRVDLTGYRLVYPANASHSFALRVAALAERLSVLTGRVISAVPDTAAAGTKDIIIGNTSRTETSAALALVRGHGFIVQYTGGKIVIAGTTNLIALSALDYFMEHCLSDSATATLCDKAVSDRYAMHTVGSTDGTINYSPTYDKDLDTDPTHTAGVATEKYYGKVNSTGHSYDYGIGHDFDYDAALAVRDALKALTGATSFGVRTDATEIEKELLVGRPDREQVVAVLSMIKGHECALAVVDGKIIVTGHCTEAMRVALTHFADYMKDAMTAEGEILLSANFLITDIVNDLWLTDVPLPEGLPLYSTAAGSENALQYLYMGNSAVNKAAFDAYCKKLTDALYRLVTSSNAEGSYFATYVSADGKKTVHVEYNAYTHASGSNYAFTDPSIRVITATVNGTYVSAPPLPSGTKDHAGYVPGGAYEYVYYGGNSASLTYYNTTYRTTIKNKSYTILCDSTSPENRFFTAVHKKTGTTLRVEYVTNYVNPDGISRGAAIIVRYHTPGIVNLPTEEILTPNQSYEKLTNAAIVSIDLSAIESQGVAVKDISYGTGYVMLLEDGRFIIIDGGGADGGMDGNTHAWAQVDNVWSILKTLYVQTYGKEPTKDEPVRIAAWIITHAHGDHMNMFWDFSNRYGAGSGGGSADKSLKGLASLEYLIANYPDESEVYNAGEASMELRNQMAKFRSYFGPFTYLKVHTGEKLYFPGVEIDTLFTTENMNPQRIVTYNDVSTVMRLTFTATENGVKKGEPVSFLSTGDAYIHTGRWLHAMYGSYLKTDMVSVSHHGGPGFEAAVYDLVAPRVVWWSMIKTSIYSSSGYLRASNWYSRVDQHVYFNLDSVDYIYIADDYHITLELTPNGPDYNGVHHVGSTAALSYYTLTQTSATSALRSAKPVVIKKP